MSLDGLGPILYWSALVVAATTILVPRISRAYAAIGAAVLVAGPVLLAVAPRTAPWLLVPVALFLFAPGLLSELVNAEFGRERYRAAGAFSLARAVVFPFDGARATARYCHAMTLLQGGRDAAALALLRRLAGTATIGLMARLQLCESRGDIAALLDAPGLDGLGAAFRLRVLGASGRVEAMIDLYRDLMASGPAMPLSVEWVRALIVLMHAGRPEGVEALTRTGRVNFSRAATAYHLGYARLAAGRDEVAAVLRRQAESDDGIVRRRARLCLADPPHPLDPGPGRTAFLDRLEAAIAAWPPRRPWWHAPATLGLVALNLGVFAAEALAGGTTSGETLYALGGLPTSDFRWPGDAWRLVTEMFLHSGPVHIGANMVSLLVLGPPVERMLGPWRFLLLYLGAGLAANVGCVLLANEGLLRDELIVGASGAIMGLVGGIAGSALREWLATRSPLFARRLLLVLAFLALQPMIDAAVPHVSSATHLIGASAGLLLGLVLPFRWPVPDAAFAASIEQPAGAAGKASPARSAQARSLFAAILVAGSFTASLWFALHP